MSPDFDLPLVPSAEQIRRREFATVRRGYDADQVRKYLKAVADQVEKLEQDVLDAKTSRAAAESKAADLTREVEALRKRVERQSAPASPAPGTDEYGDLAMRLAGMLRTAEQEAAAIKARAHEEVARVREEAEAEADRIRIDAQEKADAARAEAAQVLARAREEADRMLGGLESKRDALLAELEHMRERLQGMVDALSVIHSPAASPIPDPMSGVHSRSPDRGHAREAEIEDVPDAGIPDRVGDLVPPSPPEPPSFETDDLAALWSEHDAEELEESVKHLVIPDDLSSLTDPPEDQGRLI